MLLSITDVLIIIARLFLETVSYYNAKTMYALEGYDKLSPLLVLYLTHSLGTLIFLKDLIVHRKNYVKRVVEDTQLPFKFLVYSVIFLSLFYNLCHIPKFYAMNYLSDVSIVSIYGCSVIFTYIFAVVLINAKLDSVGVLSVSLGVLGMVLLVWNDNSINSHLYLVMCVCISSILSGMYGVFFKMVMCYKIDDKTIECLNCLEKDKLCYSEYAQDDNKVEKRCDDCIKKYQEMHNDANNDKVRSKDGEVIDEKNTDANPNYQGANDNLGVVNGETVHLESQYANHNHTDIRPEPVYQIDNQNKPQNVDYLLNNHRDIKHTTRDQNFSSSRSSNSSHVLESSEIEMHGKNINHEIEFKSKKDGQKYFFRYKITNETYRKLMFMRHYISLTGLVTLTLYWPALYLVHSSGCEDISLPKNIRPILHVIIANIFSLMHNLIYFVIVAVKTPLFAQISGIIMQPTFLFISIVENRGISCVSELSGCVLSFTAFLLLCNRH